MVDKLANMPPRIVRFLLVALDPGKTDSERGIAIREFTQYLFSVGSGGYELVERIQTEPISDADLQRMCDVAIERDRAEQQRNAVVTRPFSSAGLGNVGRSSVYGFGDTDRVAGYDVHNCSRWGDIATHCYDNRNYIPAQHHGFLEGMADQLVVFGGTITGKQAKYLNSLFTRYLAGRI